MKDSIRILWKEITALIVLLILVGTCLFSNVSSPELDESFLSGTSTPIVIREPASVEESLNGKSQKEKENIKGSEIARVTSVGEYRNTKYGDLRIEIQSIEAIEGGVQVFARAWKGDRQLGFGTTGTVDIERFRFINPPILVPDEAGTIIRESVDEKGIHSQRKLREDPQAAIKDTLAHTISVSGKTGTKIVAGSIGRTTTTVYPAAGAVAPFDGNVSNSGTVYLTVQSAATGNAVTVSEATRSIATNYFEVTTYSVRRAAFGFDIAAVGTDAISSAVFTLFGRGAGCENTNTDTINIVSATPAANDNIATADFDAFGTTVYASLAFASWNGTDNAANDFTLSAAGITYVDAFSSIGFIGTRSADEQAQSVPTGGNDCTSYFADQAGTSSDPKLVVVHGGAASTPSMILFE